MKIPFNKPYVTGKETLYIEEAIRTRENIGKWYIYAKMPTVF